MLRFICGLILFLYAEGTSIKGLYCKDPDTGKLYAVNSTWQSETFCGNYTCKLRKKNITQTEYTPIKRINLTADTLKKHQIFDDMTLSPSQKSVKTVKNDDNLQPVFHKDLMSKVNELNIESNSDEDNNDRYLTEKEIKKITELLHTVKKSDLEAIVEIYSLAQDIYKEINSTTEKPFETSHNSNEDKKEHVMKILKPNSQGTVSYWYEPLHHHNAKTKTADSKVEETYPSPVLRSYPHPSSYFKNPGADKDFGKLPYYYPLSNFQRMSSYLHNRFPFAINSPAPPCNRQSQNTIPQTLFTQPIPQKKIYPESIRHRELLPMQPALLPYPFSYVNHYNFSSYPGNFYYNNYPWAQLNSFKRYNKNPQNLNYGTFVPQISKPEEVVKSVESEDKNEDAVKIMQDNYESTENDGKKNLPEWQTDELSKNILEEVKANILEKTKLLKPLSLRKNIKIEKVGKVIKLDELSRSKRDKVWGKKVIDDKENIQFEAYIERKTCESNFEPGFFSVGNQSQPYPACCPKKISVDVNY
ncbi:hypothetical protein KGM_214959 [Danaus plexippus plexippus]|uniref:Uncharacterized protein n=1 Tax=Danaus plexippus plexippus TaxID=278856 RepID=A0A212FKN5_DANPL|nr:hypothetical protein KGM_214959 [Danaus plexippus plexippus]